MKNWIIAVILVIILIGVGYVLRYCTESSDIATEVPPNDTLYVYGDTLWTSQDTVWSVKWEKIPVVTTVDSSGVVAKNVTKDTLLVMDKDSIKIKSSATYYPSEDTFDMEIDVDFRGYDSFRIDTIKVNNYIPVEVEVDEPFYDEFVWGAGVATVIFTALILLLGG